MKKYSIIHIKVELSPYSGIRLNCFYSPYKPERMREHPAVNRRVVGSNPTGGAKISENILFFEIFLFSFFSFIQTFVFLATVNRKL